MNNELRIKNDGNEKLKVSFAIQQRALDYYGYEIASSQPNA